MTKYKQVNSLETLSMRALTGFITNLSEDLVSMLSKAFLMILPDLRSDLADNAEDEFLEEELDFLEDFEEVNRISEITRRQRRKSSTRSTDELRKSGSIQKKVTEILRSRISIINTLLKYNVPCFLFDRLCKHLFSEIPRIIDRIKQRRTIKTSQGEFMSQVNIAISLIEVVVGPFLTYCNFEETPKLLQQTFYVQLSELKGLEYLNLGSLTGGWKTDEMEPMILCGLEQMKNLQYLSLNYDCTDNILLKVIDACPNVHTLDLTSSKLINNDSVNLLIRMPKLRNVQLHRTSVTNEGYIKLLLGHKKIEDVGRNDEIGRVLEYIVDNYPDFKEFALRKFASRYVTTRFLQIISEYCPRMQHVWIFYNALICDLMALIGINNLSTLHLLACDFFSDQIRDVLAVKGCNLTHLHLEHVDQIDMNALMYISQYCPDLQVLTIYNCELIESTSLYMSKPVIPPFMNLERLTIIAQCDHRHLEFLWSTCLKIKSIKCGSVVPTTDELFERIMMRNPLQHLEELSIVRSDGLSMAMAYKFVEVCPKLSYLSELEEWSRIKDEELQMFKTFIKTNNLDLRIESRRFKSTEEEVL